MNQMQEAYVNSLVTSKAEALKKGSTDSDVFVITRSVYDEIIEAGVLDPDSDMQLRIYNALSQHRDSLN
jgi:hypothetical protein